jgi:hypothetical protein
MNAPTTIADIAARYENREILRKNIFSHFFDLISNYPIWRAAVVDSDYILSYLITVYRSTGDYGYW